MTYTDNLTLESVLYDWLNWSNDHIFGCVTNQPTETDQGTVF
jgi:hypothetical protein